MKRINRHRDGRGSAAAVLLILTIAAFFIFFFYMASAERVSVYHAEQPEGYRVFEEMQLEIVTDDTAPAGIQKVYRGTLPAVRNSAFCVNISHHNIQVYIDDLLIYSLTGEESNRIGKNVSNNWCCVAVSQSHAGKNVTVVLTPLLEAAADKSPVFLLGSHYAIITDLLIGEFPVLFLSILCIILGLLLLAAYLYYHHTNRSAAHGIDYLGLFSIVLGMWKLTDLDCIPLLFPKYAMVFGYVSVGSLFLISPSLQLYFSTLFKTSLRKALEITSCVSACICLFALGAQVLGITEIRQNLLLSHILLIVTLGSLPLTSLLHLVIHKSLDLLHTWKLLLLLMAGIALDLLLYYKNSGNGLLSFTIISFIIYTMIIFTSNIWSTARKAYTDIRTGLGNRARWNEIIHSSPSSPEPYAIIVMDLNGLKHINDTLGHDAGDQMILQAANILRNTLPASSTICRWGGDEFSVMLTGVHREQLDTYVQALFSAAEENNASDSTVPVSFAIGSSLSTEHPNLTRLELFKLADENMYQNKQAWYANTGKNK